MCGAEPSGGFDTTHSRHVDVHQHDPSTAVRNEFDCRFPGFAIAGHGEIFGGRHGGGRWAPGTGLGVHHRCFHGEPSLLRNINTALTRRSTESSTVKWSLAKMELMCFSTAR